MKQENEIKFRRQQSVNRRSTRNYILTDSKGSKQVIKYVPVLAIAQGYLRTTEGMEIFGSPPWALSKDVLTFCNNGTAPQRQRTQATRLVSGINYCRKRIKTRSQESNSLVPQRPALRKESSSTHKTQHAIKAATVLARVTIDPLGSLPLPRPDLT